MPSDANGVYTLPDGYLAVTGQTVLASQHNPPLEDLAASMSQRVMATGAKPFSGPIKAADGTASAPGVTFNSAQSTGIYKTTNGIGFSVGGVQVAELISGGFKAGARYLGELIPYSGLTAPALTVFPAGQTLSRTTYADLWAYAQTEIAGGNSFYNNGNGSTTFGIGDMRGRVPAGKDGTGAILNSTSMTPDGNTLGATGGNQQHVLTTPQTPSHNHTINDPGHVHTQRLAPAGGAGGFLTQATSGVYIDAVGVFTATAFTGITINNTGGGGAHNNVQPTIIVNYLLFAGA